MLSNVVDNVKGDDNCPITKRQAHYKPWKSEDSWILVELIHDGYIVEALENGKA